MEVVDLDEVLSEDVSSKNNDNIQCEKEYKHKNSNGKKSKKNRKKKIALEIIRLIITIAGIFLFSLFVVTFIGQRTEVNGDSMNPTLSNGDNLIVNKISYRFTKPKRFDIVVFPHEVNGEEIYFIKRVIGLPGETVQISDGVIYIDNKALDEDYGLETIKDAKGAASPVVLGDDEYFVLGDNRNHSSDSREIGVVKRKIIIGKAIFKIWPFEDFGKLR